MRHHQSGLKGQGAIKRRDGVIETVQLLQRFAEIVPRLGIAGIEFHSLVISRSGVLQLTFFKARIAEVVIRIPALGIPGRRQAADPRLRFVIWIGHAM
jgi:hypothetical protein